MKKLDRHRGNSVVDGLAAATQAGLHYVNNDGPGYRRIRNGGGFQYVDTQGKRIHDGQRLLRIKRLAIPPAWTDVWICPSPHGHIQATGRDARGRKQYRYHERWREVRDEAKYSRMRAFGQALPAIRRQARKDLALPGLPRQKVIATLVRLLETTYIRVGNPEYMKRNGSFGLTTLRSRQAKVQGRGLRFEFPGKGGKRVRFAFCKSPETMAEADRRLGALGDG